MNGQSSCPSAAVRRLVVALGSTAALITGCQREAPQPAATTDTQPATSSESPASRPLEPRAAAPEPRASAAARPAASHAAPAASGPVYGACVELCARSRELKCANAASCPDACQAMAGDLVCAEPLLAAMRCFAAQPSSRWACGEDGLAAVKDGNCDREQSHYVECVGRAAEH